MLSFFYYKILPNPSRTKFGTSSLIGGEILPNPPFSKEGIELVPLFVKERLGEIFLPL